MEIVGVVNSASLWWVQRQEPLAVYVPLMQGAGYQPMVDIRAAGDLGRLVRGARETLESMDHHYPLLIQN